MTEPTGVSGPALDAAGGFSDWLVTFVRGPNVRRASQLTRRGREREIGALQRAGMSRQQARRTYAAARRRGERAVVVQRERATPEQAQRAEQFQQRSVAAQQRYQERQNTRAFVSLSPDVQPSDSGILTTGPLDAKRDELISKSHWLYDYLESQDPEHQPKYNETQFQAKVARMSEAQLDAWLAAANSNDYSVIRASYARTEPLTGYDNAFWYHL